MTDLRTMYGLIRYAERVGEGEEVMEWVKQLKREVREHVNRASDRFVINGDMDGYTAVIDVPADTIEEAEEWFEAKEFLGYPAWLGGAISWGADCTGQAFTIWHKIVRLGGRLVCFHRVGIDV